MSPTSTIVAFPDLTLILTLLILTLLSLTLAHVLWGGRVNEKGYTALAANSWAQQCLIWSLSFSELLNGSGSTDITGFVVKMNR